MKRLAFILLLLAWFPQVTKAQVSESALVHLQPWDPAYWDEKVDTLKSYTIKPVKSINKLMKGVIKQLQTDCSQEYELGRYQIDATFIPDSLPPFSATCIVSAEASSHLHVKEMGELNYDGPKTLTHKDSAYIKERLSVHAEYQPYSRIFFKTWADALKRKKPNIVIQEMTHEYNVKAYSISDAFGKGVYRISFVPKKNPKDSYYVHHMIKHTCTLYFDIHTLRLTQSNGKETSFSLGIDHKTGQVSWSNPIRDNEIRFQMDYGGEGVKSILKQAKFVWTRKGGVEQTTVRRVNK